MFEIVYKIIWLVIVAYPLWSRNQLGGSPAEEMTHAFVWVIPADRGDAMDLCVQDLRLGGEEEPMIPKADAQTPNTAAGSVALSQFRFAVLGGFGVLLPHYDQEAARDPMKQSAEYFGQAAKR
jgi:hypothetical protein